MRKTTVAAIVGLLLLLAIVMGCGTIGMGVRAGAISEVLVRFPPETRYQVILRIGSDARPWERGNRPDQAINLWVHGTGTDWHIVSLVHVPLGERRQDRE